MHALRKRLGLILFSAIWLSVLLVPVWRWRAGNQIREVQNGFDFSAGLSPALQQEAARRFPDDPAAQFAPLRGFSQQALVREYSAQPHDAAKLSALVARYFGRYDALQRRFPDANFGRIQRLRDTCIGGFALDEGPVEAPNAANAPLLPGAVPTPRPTPWFPPAQREAALSVAREGARRDPNNGFFPWMEAILEFSFRRNDNALRALQVAGGCKGWDDDTLGTPRRRLGVLRRLRFVASEDPVSEWYSMLLPHFAAMRSASRAALWQAKQARARGDNRRAWQIIGSLQRAAGVLATRSNSSVLSRLVGEAICVNTWSFALTGQVAPPPMPYETTFYHTPQMVQEREAFNRALAARFAADASAQGYGDLAREARELVAQMDGERLQASYSLQPPAPPIPWVRTIGEFGRAYYLNTLSLRYVLFAAPLWAVCALLTKGREELTARTLRRSLLLSMCGAGICAYVFVLLWTHQLGDWIFLLPDGRTMNGFPGVSLPGSLAPFALPFEAWAMGSMVWWVLRHTPWKRLGQWTRREFSRREFSRRPRLAWAPVRPVRVLLLVLGGLLLLAAWAAWQQGADVAAFLWSENGNIVLVPALCAALGVSVWRTPWKRLAQWAFALRPRLSRGPMRPLWVLLMALGALSLLAAGAAWREAPGVVAVLWSENGNTLLLAALGGVLAGSVWLLLTGRAKRTAQRWRVAASKLGLAGWVRWGAPLWAWALRGVVQLAAWLRPACAVIALMASLVYFALSLTTLPTERTAKAQLGHMFEIGEAAFLREQLGARTRP